MDSVLKGVFGEALTFRGHVPTAEVNVDSIFISLLSRHPGVHAVLHKSLHRAPRLFDREG